MLEVFYIKRSAVFGHLAMLCFSMFVSVSFTLGSLVANQIDPFVVTEIRFILASILIGFVFYLHKKASVNDLKFPMRFFLLGGMISCYFVTMFEGLKTADPISMSAIFTLTPIMAGVFDFIISKRKLSIFAWSAVLMGGFGALWIIFEGKPEKLLALDIGYGETVFFFGCLGHAIYAALIPRLNRGESPISQTFGTLLAASIILSVIGFEQIALVDWLSISELVWVTVIYLAVFATAASFFLIQFAATRLSAVKVMAYTYAIPFWVTSLEFSLSQAVLSAHLILGGFAIFISLTFLLINNEF